MTEEATIDREELRRLRAWYWDTPREDRRTFYRKMLLISEASVSSDMDALDALLEFALFYGKRTFNLFEVSDYAAEYVGTAAYEHEVVGALIEAANSGGYARLRVQDDYYRGSFVGSSFEVEFLWDDFFRDWERTLEIKFPPDGEVYLLAGGGYHKIGRARVVSERVKQLGILLPYPVELAHHFPCDGYASSERTLHEMFAEKRTHGEWFALEDNDVALIENIAFMRGSVIEWEQVG